MMHMDDCLAATYALMAAPRASLTRTTYNVTAVSFTPSQLAEAIEKEVPGFTVDYQPDFRDGIARTWPASIDDAAARRDWGWRHALGLRELVRGMLADLAPQYDPAKLAEAAAAAAAQGQAQGQAQRQQAPPAPPQASVAAAA
jgi:nucleoside-diphosphate-sugar epimerase